MTILAAFFFLATSKQWRKEEDQKDKKSDQMDLT